MLGFSQARFRGRLTRSIVNSSLLVLVVVTAGDASPPPDQRANGRIAFAYRGGLILTNPDGTGQWPLTRGGSSTRTATLYSLGDWSPDGTQLVGVGYGDLSHASLYLFDGRGREGVRLTSTGSSGEYDPSFSPDGRKSHTRVTPTVGRPRSG